MRQHIRESIWSCFQQLRHFYDVEGLEGHIQFAKHRDASNNIYIGIKHDLLTSVDSVLEAVVKELEDAMAKTFWALPNAYQYGQACQALAKRGLNIDAITLYLSAGGVGMSVYSEMMVASYGDEKHRYFDPNLFFIDEELCKCVENICGGFIFTGQETPTGGRFRCR